MERAKFIVENCERPQALSLNPYEKHLRLVANMAMACPAWVACAEENENLANMKGRWYAAGNIHPPGHGNPPRVLLFQPRIAPYPSAADAGMPNIRAKISFPLPLASAELAKTLVIVSDSSLELPGVICGLQRAAALIEPTPLRLQFIAVCPGVGAKELANAWTKAPA